MKKLTLKVPYPPSVNHYYRALGVGISVVSRRGRAYRKALAGAVKPLLAGAEPLQGRLSVTVGLVPPDRRRRDIDNVLKALLDGLTHAGAWKDDSQIRRLVVAFVEGQIGGFATVEIEEME